MGKNGPVHWIFALAVFGASAIGVGKLAIAMKDDMDSKARARVELWNRLDEASRQHASSDQPTLTKSNLAP